MGFCRGYSFNTGDLTTCGDVLLNYLEAYESVPWDDLRYMFGEVRVPAVDFEAAWFLHAGQEASRMLAAATGACRIDVAADMCACLLCHPILALADLLRRPHHRWNGSPLLHDISPGVTHSHKGLNHPACSTRVCCAACNLLVITQLVHAVLHLVHKYTVAQHGSGQYHFQPLCMLGCTLSYS
jgi:hypothetical protein